jgi:hypothetical protein
MSGSQDFQQKIKIIRRDQMLNEYPQEFVDCVMKPLRGNHPSSDTVYQGTVIIPYVKGISGKFRRIGNRFKLRIIFKTKYTTRGILMKTGPVRDPSRRSSLCTAIHAIVADVTSVKQADL